MNLKKDLLIFVVEDNKIFNRVVCQYLRKMNYTNVKSFLSGKECIDAVSNGESPAVVIQDYFLEDYTGIEVMKYVKEQHKHSSFIFLTVNENLEEAVETVKRGAFDYILKDRKKTLERVADDIEEINIRLYWRKKIKRVGFAIFISLVILLTIMTIAVRFSLI